MTVRISPFGPKPQFLDANGNPMNGAKFFWYVAGSSTKQNTHTDSTGTTPNANPIVLNSRGESPNEIWLTEGLSYKALLSTAIDDPPSSSVWTVDNLVGINDALSPLLDQWIAGPTPTFISATSFSLVGDQTVIFHVGRRLKTINSGGTIYSLITASAFTTITTITVQNDSGILDAGLSAVSYGLLSSVNHGMALITDAHAIVSGSADKTKKVRLEVDGLTTGTTRVLTVQDEDGTIAVTTEFAYANVAGALGRMPFPQDWISGLQTANNAVDAVNDIDITTGNARDSTNADNMILASALTKRIDASWAVGTNQGGLDGTESIAGTPDNDTWYYVWLIQRSDTGVVDALFSESSSAPIMPANYDRKRLIGAVRRGTAANRKVYQEGGRFRYQAAIALLTTGTATVSTAVTISSAVPPIAASFSVSARAEFTFGTTNTNSGNDCIVRVATGVDYATVAGAFGVNGGTAAFTDYADGGVTEIPNTGTFEYRNAENNTGTRSSTIRAHGFTLAR